MGHEKPTTSLRVDRNLSPCVAEWKFVVETRAAYSCGEELSLINKFPLTGKLAFGAG